MVIKSSSPSLLHVIPGSVSEVGNLGPERSNRLGGSLAYHCVGHYHGFNPWHHIPPPPQHHQASFLSTKPGKVPERFL